MLPIDHEHDKRKSYDSKLMLVKEDRSSSASINLTGFFPEIPHPCDFRSPFIKIASCLKFEATRGRKNRKYFLSESTPGLTDSASRSSFVFVEYPVPGHPADRQDPSRAFIDPRHAELRVDLRFVRIFVDLVSLFSFAFTAASATLGERKNAFTHLKLLFTVEITSADRI